MKSFLNLIICVLVLSSCGGGGDAPNPIETKELGAFNLTFPDNNQLCTEGETVNETTTAVNFKWSTSENATGYLLEITNTENNAKISETVNGLEKKINLAKGEPFSWTVTAQYEDKILKSALWNFYSEGVALQNYAPFPASITVLDNKDKTITITWQGDDLDNDIATYEVYFDTTDNPALVLTTSTDNDPLKQPITYGTVHNLKIITIDALGNKSIAKKSINYIE